ncbi:MAG: hypothetical protein CL510_00180 [Actinobacteria bacterium]|nr:hypothetical protein [Actinomycetota bacterium]|tara:strand:- start:1140 stop:1802 length:663 start_codon:yes stop_codon:yes gene_type:complete
MAEILEAGLLQAIPHGFSTAVGLDVGEILPGAPLVRLKQVHSNTVYHVAEPWRERPEGDGLCTDRPGLALGIVTADCAPVLFADPGAGVVGAAHAGWRGALSGVLENTVEAMISLGARRDLIRAAIGPTIAQASYEVDHQFREQFGDGDEQYFAVGRQGRYQFDLPAYVAHRLQAAGVLRIEDLAEDTYTQPDRFFSFRRATHRAEADEGRQLSVIAVPA